MVYKFRFGGASPHSFELGFFRVAKRFHFLRLFMSFGVCREAIQQANVCDK